MRDHDSPPIHAVDLFGAGVHPAAWRREDSRAEEVFTARYWVDAVGRLDRAGADLAFFHDTFAGAALGGSAGNGEYHGHLDAAAIAARVGATTRRIALAPTVTATHTEPFHVSKAIASLDFATLGRAAWEVAVSGSVDEAALFGRKGVQDAASLWAEVVDAVTVASLLWDSWEDDAEIRDVATGRFVDRDKLHYIDFEGPCFSVKGPSITPRPPQGRPPVVVRADDADALGAAAAVADIVRVSASSVVDAARTVADVRDAIASVRGSADAGARVLLDVDTVVASTIRDAEADLAQLEHWSGTDHEPSSLLFVGDAPGLAALTSEVIGRGGADGVTYRPLALASGTEALASGVLPLVTPTLGASTTLRERLGFRRPDSVFAASHTEGRS